MTRFEVAKEGFGVSSYDLRWYNPIGNVEDNIENGIEDCELVVTRRVYHGYHLY